MGRKVNPIRRINKNTIEFRPTYKIALSTMKGKRKITKVYTHLRNPKPKKRRTYTNWQAASAQASKMGTAESDELAGNQAGINEDEPEIGASQSESDAQKGDWAWPPGWPSGWDATAMQELPRDQEWVERELEAFWDRGMKSRLSDLVKDASEATGLPTGQVKTWLTNKQKREKRAEAKDQGIETPRRPKVPLRKKRGYDLFMSDRMNQEDLKSLGNKQQGTKLRVAQEEWRTLPDDEKAMWNRRAEIRTSEVVQDLDVAEQKLKQLKAKCTELWELGVNVTLMIPPIPEKESDLQVFCPPEHRPFWEQSHTAPLLHEYGLLTGSNDARVAFTAMKSSDRLRKEVQNIFNAGYEKATGRKRAFNYKEMDEGKVLAYGMPAGVVLKRPSAYNTREKEAIIDNADRITFQVDNTDSTPVQPQLGVPWTLMADDQTVAVNGASGPNRHEKDPGTASKRKRASKRKASDEPDSSGSHSGESTAASDDEVLTYDIEPVDNPSDDPSDDTGEGSVESTEEAMQGDIDLVGKTINHMWAVGEEGKEKKQWFRGSVRSRGDTHYAILYEGYSQPTQCPVEAVHEAFRQQSIKLLDPADYV